MSIELQWAFTEDDMTEGPCAICEADFEPRAVIIRCDPHGSEICEGCLRALTARKEAFPGAPWPTWEEYEALVAAHPEPMFSSAEEVAASEEETADPETGRWPAYDASWLWRVPEEGDETHHLMPTVVYRAGAGTFEAAVTDHERGRALFVFGSEEEAEEYRLRTGNYPAEDGFRNVPLDLTALKDLLALHECTHVVMPVSMLGDEGPDFFAAGDFVGMLEASPPA